jgi:hypothetical protein
MAVTKTILKSTNQETIVKIAGTAGSATIDLQTDCLDVHQALDGATQTVNIAGLQWTGLAASVITIARNSVNINTINAGDSGTLYLADGNGYVDATENTSDVVVSISGAEAQCYIRLRKVGGYATKIETAQFGSYDNPAVVGS